MRFAKKVTFAVCLSLFVLCLVNPAVFAQDIDYSRIRLKIFHLLNLVPGDEATSPNPTPGGPIPTIPGSPPLATPMPVIKHTIINYKGVQVGTAEYQAISGYNMSANIPETADPSFDYYIWLKKSNPDAFVLLTPTAFHTFIISYHNSEDLKAYTDLIVTEEQPGSPAPTSPIHVKYSAS